MENERVVFESLHGELVTKEELNIEGIDKPIPFDIYDGFAIGYDDGKQYMMEYPKMETIKESDEFSDTIMKYIGTLTDKAEISPIHVLITFNTLYIDGVEVNADKEEENG